MTTPREEQPRHAEVPVPTVATAPARSRWRGGWLPARLGRARTSTVVLALLWLAVFTLYVFVRPPSPATQTTGGTVQQQVDPAPAPATTARRAPTPAPDTTVPGTTPPEDTTTSPPSTRPPGATTPPDVATTAPTTAGPTTSAPAPGSATDQVPVPAPTPTGAPSPASPTP